MKNKLRDGDILDVQSAPYALTAGQGALVGRFFGVAINDALIGAKVELETDAVFLLTKHVGTAWTQGQLLYWDDTAREVTTTSNTGANELIGFADQAAASADTTGAVNVTGQVS